MVRAKRESETEAQCGEPLERANTAQNRKSRKKSDSRPKGDMDVVEMAGIEPASRNFSSLLLHA